MSARSGFYIVPTDRWYIERTVWLIAGFVLIGSTTLAATAHPFWALFIIATGLASIVVSLTGFCVIGNVLKPLGFRGRLDRHGDNPRDLYFMQTDAWYLERRIYLVVGINISIASVLSIVHSPWWLTFTGFVGVALMVSAGIRVKHLHPLCSTFHLFYPLSPTNVNTFYCYFCPETYSQVIHRHF